MLRLRLRLAEAVLSVDKDDARVAQGKASREAYREAGISQQNYAMSC